MLATVAGALPQMAAWKALYDTWLLPYPPQGPDFVRLGRPFLLETLFSSRHGLLFWTPALWLAYLGLGLLLVRRPALALPLALPVAAMTYVNACAGDWWAGGSFSNRRFDSALPLLAFGLAASIEALLSLLAARPGLALGAIALPLAVWNVGVLEQERQGLVPAGDAVSFAERTEHTARLLGGAVGSPPAWPANWLFAWQTGRPASQYDVLVGRYLFYRQNNLGGLVDLGSAGDEALLGEGWGPAETWDGASARALIGRARLFAPLDEPEDLRITVRVAGGSELRVSVNGRAAGTVSPGPSWAEHTVATPAALWRRNLNEVVLEAGPGAAPHVDRIRFERLR
jgi:hypothetical protein